MDRTLYYIAIAFFGMINGLFNQLWLLAPPHPCVGLPPPVRQALALAQEEFEKRVSAASFTPRCTANWGQSSNGLHALHRPAKGAKLAPAPTIPECHSRCMRGLDPRIHLKMHRRFRKMDCGSSPTMTRDGLE
jgi:hypothetical protein